MVEIDVKFKKNVKDLENAGQSIAKSINNTLKKTGIGDVVGGMTKAVGGVGAAMGMNTKAIQAGVAGGMAAGGVIGLLKMLVDVFADFPLIVAIFKLFKLILTLLFLPLIPILKPIVIALGNFAKSFAKVMKATEGVVEEHPMVKALNMMLEGLAKWWELLATILVGVLGVFAEFYDSISGIIEKGISLLPNVIQIILDALTWAGENLASIWGVIQSILEWVGENLDPVWKFIKTILDTAVTYLKENFDKVIETLANAWLTLTTAWGYISDVLGDVKTMLVDKWDKIKDALSNALTWLQNAIETLKTIPLVKGVFKETEKPSDSVIKAIDEAAKKGPFAGMTAKTGIPMLGGDFVVTPQGTIKTSPGDYIMGMKNPAGMGGVININISNPSFSNKNDIRELVGEIERRLSIETRRRVSYTGG